MSASENDVQKGPSASVKIERMNIEKTRRQAGSETVYHVYFDLSGYPPPEWRTIFQERWVATKLPHPVDLEQSFVVAHCQLQEVAPVILPALTHVVTETNAAYAQFAQKQATDLEHREDLWREERQRVEATAASLSFE
jgi:hypothetical protein